jgi:ParB-like chromosome segregation protein Spo0J
VHNTEIPTGIAESKFAQQARPQTTITRDIPLALLDEPLDPMRHDIADDYLLELGNDIRESGLLQNLCVVPTLDGKRVVTGGKVPFDSAAHIAEGGRFRVAAGHCRLLACRVVRYDPVRCEIFCDQALSEEQIMHAENEHRADPTDFDKAVLYAKWIQEPGMTEKELAHRAGKSLEFIYARAELLQGYKIVADAVHARQIPFTVARALNRWDEPEYVQHWLNMAVDQGAKVKTVQGWIDERKSFKALAVPAGPPGMVGVTVHTQHFTKVECICCGNPQSYELTTAMVCGACRERIGHARAAVEQADAGGAAP